MYKTPEMELTVFILFGIIIPFSVGDFHYENMPM